MFSCAAQIEGFDFPGRVTVTDQEKGIDAGFNQVKKNARLFLETLHVNKKLLPSAVSESSMAGTLYDQEVKSP